MPRTKLNKEKEGLRKNYFGEDTIQAIKAVKLKKFGHFKTAKVFNMSRSTIIPYMCSKVNKNISTKNVA